MSYPILYQSTETAFDTNGIGILSDAVSCVVTEARNGSFELEMQYPLDGVHYGHIAQRSLLLAAPNPADAPQPFRVYRISRPLNGIVTVYARHISYDLSGVPAQPFTAANAPAALAALKSAAVVDCPFDFWTDKTTAATMAVKAPASIRSLLGGSSGSVLDVYGGELAFDRYTVRLYGQRGADRGVSIRYGKNLTDLKQDENCASVYTGCCPYWLGQDGTLVTLPEKTLAAEGSYDFVRILTLDLSAEWMEPPSVDALRARAQAYMADNRIGVPTVSLTISWAQLEQSEEYKNTALLERVLLCDTVRVEFPALGVSASAKCVKTVYNCLLDRYDSVDLGDARTTLADTIAGQSAALQQSERRTKTYLQTSVDAATSQITGNRGGYVVLHSSTGGKEPDEILIMDTPDIATAANVWRWNKAGLGYSGKGYNGPYSTAITQDGHIVADFVATGTLDAAQINVINLVASRLTSTNGGYTFDVWAAVEKLMDGDDLRVRIYTTGTEASYGLVQVFGGTHPEDGTQDESSRYSWLSPYSIGVGEDQSGAYTGTVHTGTVYTGTVHTGTVRAEQELYAGGSVQVDAQSGVLGHPRVDTNEVRVRDGSAQILSVADGKRTGHFERLAIAGNAAQDVRWVYSSTLGGYVLTTAYVLN